MDASTPQASFLGLPTELRLLIYEYVLEPDTFTFEDPKYGSQDSDSDVGSGSHSQCFQDIRAFNIVLRGSFPGREEDLSNPPSRTQNPWVLGMICRQVRDESAKVLATVSYSDVFFSFYGFTPDDMRSWVQHMGPERVARMRRWAIEGYNWCDSWFFWAEAPEEDPYCEEDHGHRSPHKEQVQCYRAITTNLDLSEDSPPGDIAGYHAYSYIMAGDSDDLDVTIYGNCRYGGSQENVIHRAWGVSCVKRFELATVDALGSFCEPAAEGIGSKGMGFKRICTKQGLIASAEAVIGKDPFDDERLVKKFPASKDCREGG